LLHPVRRRRRRRRRSRRRISRRSRGWFVIHLKSINAGRQSIILPPPSSSAVSAFDHLITACLLPSQTLQPSPSPPVLLVPIATSTMMVALTGRRM